MNKKKIRDYAFKGIIGVIFLVIVYYSVFASSSEDSPSVSTGLNTELPEGNAEPLKEKMNAYENASMEESKEKRMKTLNDYVFDLKNDNNGSPEDESEKYDVEIKPASKENASNDGLDAIRKSLTARSQAEEVEEEYYRVQTKNENLQQEVDRLKRELKDKQNSERTRELLEKSYEAAGHSKREVAPGEEINRETVEVSKKDGELVSTLSEELLEDAPYNYGFITAAGSGYKTGSNTIRACVSEEQTVTAGQRVMFRLLEPLQAGSTTIPRNHQIAGTTRIQGDRMDIQIENIEYAGNIIPVNMKVYDTDGMPGIYCPGSQELDALKEGAANLGSGLGSSISFTRSAGQQVAMDLTRGVMNGASQYLAKKMRTVKVTLKSNYEVLLLPKNN